MTWQTCDIGGKSIGVRLKDCFDEGLFTQTTKTIRTSKPH